MPENENLKISQEELFARLNNSNSGSLLKKYLTRDVYNKLKDRVTSFGGTIGDCIRSGNLFCDFFLVYLCNVRKCLEPDEYTRLIALNLLRLTVPLRRLI